MEKKESIMGVPSSQALPGFIITTPPSVCVPDVIGVQAVWIQTPKKKPTRVEERASEHLLCATKRAFPLCYIF